MMPAPARVTPVGRRTNVCRPYGTGCVEAGALVPRLALWATICRPYGTQTVRAARRIPTARAVGYDLSSLRDCPFGNGVIDSRLTLWATVCRPSGTLYGAAVSQK